MTFLLPDFSDETFRELSVCAIFHNHTPQEVARLPDKPIEFQTELPIGTHDSAWMRVQIDRRDDDWGHVHCDIGRDYRRINGLDEVPLNAAFSWLEKFVGQEAGMGIYATFNIPIKELPPYGTLATLMDVTTESCGHNMSVSGATMSIEGEDFTKLKWERSEDGECIAAKLYADCEATIDESFLTEMVSYLRSGIDCLVLEAGDGWFPDSTAEEHNDDLPKSAEG